MTSINLLKQKKLTTYSSNVVYIKATIVGEILTCTLKAFMDGGLVIYVLLIVMGYMC